MSEKQLILSFFADEPAADAAALTLKESGAAPGDAIGLLVVDDAGELKVDKVGARSWGAGAGVGAALFVLGPAFWGLGVAGGTALGGLHHKGLKLSDAEKARIADSLKGGEAAVGALVRMEDAAAVRAQLDGLGGAVSVHDVVDEAELQAAAQ